MRLPRLLLGWSPVSYVDTMAIPSGITRDHVLTAIRRYEDGERGDFGEPTRYYVLWDGGRYPPKTLVGFAAREVIGRDLSRREFSGGARPGQANTLLLALGFDVRIMDGVEPLRDGENPGSRDGLSTSPGSLVFASNRTTSSGHEYADIVGVQYEYPRVYRNQIQPGRRFVYYRSREQREQPYYWGTGIVGPIRASREGDRLICTVLDYREFEQRVPFRDANGEYLEPGGSTRGYYQRGVRTLTDSVFDRIVERGSVIGPDEPPEAAGQRQGARRQYATSEHALRVEEISMELIEHELALRFPGQPIRRMPHNNPGYDFEVGPRHAVERYVEAKGTIAGYVHFFVSEGERQYSINHADRYTLAVAHSLDLAARTGVVEWFDDAIDGRFVLEPTQWRARRASAAR